MVLEANDFLILSCTVEVNQREGENQKQKNICLLYKRNARKVRNKDVQNKPKFDKN